MIKIYNKNEIEILRQGGKILAKIMEELKKEVKPGVTTQHLNKVAEDLVFSWGAKPSFEGFEGFPAALCTSINEEIVHAVPKERKIEKGNLLSLDFGVKYKGYFTDMAVTVGIGKINKEKKELIKVTKEALKIGIKQAKPDNHLGNIGYAIQKYVEKNGFNVVRELVGHGVGKQVHEAPRIPNYGSPEEGAELKSGMVLAIEPMVTVGDWHVEKTKGGFGYKTVDNSLSCHFEHTIAITPKGPKVLTKI